MSNWMTDVEPRFKGRAGRGAGGWRLSSALRSLCAFSVLLGVSLLVAFLGINLMLGCETWDQSLWTSNNSCLTPGMVLDGIRGR